MYTDLQPHVGEPVLVPEADVVAVLVHQPGHLPGLQVPVVLVTGPQPLQVEQHYASVETLVKMSC